MLLLVWQLSVALGLPKPSPPPSSYQPLERKEGALLHKRQLPDGNEAYRQIINLQKMQIDQLIREVDKKWFPSLVRQTSLYNSYVTASQLSGIGLFSRLFLLHIPS